MLPEVQAVIDELKAKSVARAQSMKEQALQNAEDEAKDVAEASLKIVDAYVKSSKTPFDDMAWMAVRAQAAEALAKYADMIKK